MIRTKMEVEQKSIFEYLSKNDFLIPMYQRPYVWGIEECEQLWDDVLNFFESKEENDEYFLGSIVAYDEENRQSIIDGQQRTTTLMIFIRALFEKTNKQKSKSLMKLKDNLASCLWRQNLLSGQIDFEKTRLKSEVATDRDNDSLKILFEEHLNIEQDVKKQTLYEKNFSFFQAKIDELAQNKLDEWANFCLCLLHYCVVLHIRCDGQEKALRIFNTLNNRGLSLSTADILKGLIFQSKNDKEKLIFANKWKKLEGDIQDSNYLKKEDVTFLFMQYQHIIRALHNELDTVIPSPLDFWIKKDKSGVKRKKVNYAANDDMLTQNETFEFIIKLGNFWCNPYEILSLQSQKYLSLLTIYQNKLWQMVVSMCFYEFDKSGDESIFDEVLPQLLAYNALGLIYGKSGNSGLFWGYMKANVNLKDGKRDKIFEKSLNLPSLKMPSLENFIDFSKKALAKQIRYILALYALIYDRNQEVEWNNNGKNYNLVKLEIEHIFPRKYSDAYYDWDKNEADEFLEQIGNKILIEKKLNIQAGNDYFLKKKESYQKSHLKELQDFAKSSKINFYKADIEERNRQIYEAYERLFKETF